MIRTAFAIWGCLFRGMLIASAMYVTVEGIIPHMERRYGPFPNVADLFASTLDRHRPDLIQVWRLRP